jgi:hypothetical protein
MYRIKQFINKIKKVFYWLPYIWKDEDWDYTYIYDLLYAKLNRMEDYWKNCDDWIRSANHNKEYESIKIAKNLCKRLSEENYLTNATFWHDKKYGDYLDFKNILNDENVEREKDFIKAIELATNNKKRDREYLFDLLKNKIKDWWI